MLWIVIASIIAFGIGMYVGEYKSLEESKQILYEAEQALDNAREYLAEGKALCLEAVATFTEAVGEEAFKVTTQQD